MVKKVVWSNTNKQTKKDLTVNFKHSTALRWNNLEFFFFSWLSLWSYFFWNCLMSSVKWPMGRPSWAKVDGSGSVQSVCIQICAYISRKYLKTHGVPDSFESFVENTADSQTPCFTTSQSVPLLTHRLSQQLLNPRPSGNEDTSGFDRGGAVSALFICIHLHKAENYSPTSKSVPRMNRISQNSTWLIQFCKAQREIVTVV